MTSMLGRTLSKRQTQARIHGVDKYYKSYESYYWFFVDVGPGMAGYGPPLLDGVFDSTDSLIQITTGPCVLTGLRLFTDKANPTEIIVIADSTSVIDMSSQVGFFDNLTDNTIKSMHPWVVNSTTHSLANHVLNYRIKNGLWLALFDIAGGFNATPWVNSVTNIGHLEVNFVPLDSDFIE